MYNYIILSTKVKMKGEAMETKEEFIMRLAKKIDKQHDMIRDNLSYLQQALNEMDSSLNTISFLSYLKDDFVKKDGV